MFGYINTNNTRNNNNNRRRTMRFTLNEVGANPTYCFERMTEKQQQDSRTKWFNRFIRLAKRHIKSIDEEEEKNNDTAKSARKSARKLQKKKELVRDMVQAIVAKVKQREREEGFVLLDNPEYINAAARAIGLVTRGLPEKDTGLQSIESYELCKDRSIPWTDHSTKDHWYPAQWAGYDLFWDEYYGRHKEGDIMEKLERYREVVVVTKRQNLVTLKKPQMPGNYKGPRESYDEAGIRLVERTETLPSKKKEMKAA